MEKRKTRQYPALALAATTPRPAHCSPLQAHTAHVDPMQLAATPSGANMAFVPLPHVFLLCSTSRLPWTWFVRCSSIPCDRSESSTESSVPFGPVSNRIHRYPSRDLSFGWVGWNRRSPVDDTIVSSTLDRETIDRVCPRFCVGTSPITRKGVDLSFLSCWKGGKGGRSGLLPFRFGCSKGSNGQAIPNKPNHRPGGGRRRWGSETAHLRKWTPSPWKK